LTPRGCLQTGLCSGVAPLTDDARKLGSLVLCQCGGGYRACASSVARGDLSVVVLRCEMPEFLCTGTGRGRDAEAERSVNLGCMDLWSGRDSGLGMGKAEL